MRITHTSKRMGQVAGSVFRLRLRHRLNMPIGRADVKQNLHNQKNAVWQVIGDGSRVVEARDASG